MRRRLPPTRSVDDMPMEVLMAEASLFPLSPFFDSGIELSKEDHKELSRGLARVLAVLRDGRVHTVKEIAYITGAPENSVSANCRNLRKAKHGGYPVELVHISGRTFGYQLKKG